MEDPFSDELPKMPDRFKICTVAGISILQIISAPNDTPPELVDSKWQKTKEHSQECGNCRSLMSVFQNAIKQLATEDLPNVLPPPSS